MSTEKLLNILKNFVNDDIDTDIETLDLTNDNDYGKFKDYVADVRKMIDEEEYLSSFFKIFGFYDINGVLDEIEALGEMIHKNAEKEETETTNGDEVVEVPELPELPSKSTPMETQAKMHKIVGEYVDTYIRPYGNMDTNVVDDVYAGLFEFACWVMNK